MALITERYQDQIDSVLTCMDKFLHFHFLCPGI